jgi:hypothetical protein
MTPPVRARTILAACHEASVDLSRGALAEMPFDLVDVLGLPHLVIWGDRLVPPGAGRVRLAGVADRLGELVLDGELGRQSPAAGDAAVWGTLRAHLSCLRPEWRDIRLLSLVSTVPVVVREVRLRLPGGGEDLAVAPADFSATAEDSWALHGPEVGPHLEAHHQGGLRDVVLAQAGVRASAVTVRALDRDGAVLAALCQDGVHDVILPFEPSAETPQEAVDRLRRWAAGAHR